MKQNIISWSIYLVIISAVITCRQNNTDVAIAGTSKHVIINTTAKANDTILFRRIMRHLVHDSSSIKWPATAHEPPAAGAILPYNRILAYYGNLYSTRMGILGALPPDSMLQQLQKEVQKWGKADTLIPVKPALHYIAVTAQPAPGKDKKYRLRMPASEIEKVLAMARKANALLFLDIQVGHSNVAEEIAALEKYLLMPDVHLGIDAEYSMKNGQVPCSSIGTFDAADVNAASGYIARLVHENALPPKVLVVHRFTQGMITNYTNIKLRPEVQIVMNMDGFGSPTLKISSYRSWIAGQPVQFTGFKLFYINDKQTGGRLMEPSEVLRLYPAPIYIQYQ